jgi:hypothetical protein
MDISSITNAISSIPAKTGALVKQAQNDSAVKAINPILKGTARNSSLLNSFNVNDNYNPYSRLYDEKYGYIFGKPLPMNPKADPNQRIYQRTTLRNNTILNMIPGVPYSDKAMLDRAEKIIDDHEERIKKVDAMKEGPDKEKQYVKVSQDTQAMLIKQKCDLRYLSFKPDTADYLRSFQIVANRVGSAIFGWEGGLPRYISDLAGFNIPEAAVTGGFKVWVEKGTSISESVDNSFTTSVLESTVQGMTGAMKQLRFATGGLFGSYNKDAAQTEVVSDNKDLQSVGQMSSAISASYGGSSFQFPQVFDNSHFARNYDVSFKFVSPYGDDRSVFYHVITPFLFLLTLALPKQDGVSALNTPYLIQVDAPGFFSCPMGVINNFSFRKGGDEMLFSNRGLPLIIEGSFSIMDLYSALSLPTDYNQFATNFGTSAFLNTMGGLSLYATMDPSLSQQALNYTKDIITNVVQPYNVANAWVHKVKRYFGE